MRSRRAAPLVALVITTAIASACPDDPPPADPEPRPLADASAWVRVTDPAVDVFAAMRPGDAVCDESGYFVDPFTQAFEVETELCNYLTVRQPALEALGPGDVVSLQAFHFELTADAPAEGYMGLAIDGEVAWEQTLPIPSAPGPVSGEVTIDRELPAGAELQIHVHNHGPNSYQLLSLMVTPAG